MIDFLKNILLSFGLIICGIFFIFAEDVTRGDLIICMMIFLKGFKL